MIILISAGSSVLNYFFQIHSFRFHFIEILMSTSIEIEIDIGIVYGQDNSYMFSYFNIINLLSKASDTCMYSISLSYNVITCY